MWVLAVALLPLVFLQGARPPDTGGRPTRPPGPVPAQSACVDSTV